MGILRLAVPLEHKALHHMRDDVALEAVVRSFSKNRVRPDRPREIFVGNRVHPIRHMRLKRSEEHTSELQSLMRISYAVFCLTKKPNSHTPSTTLIPHHKSASIRTQLKYNRL